MSLPGAGNVQKNEESFALQWGSQGSPTPLGILGKLRLGGPGDGPRLYLGQQLSDNMDAWPRDHIRLVLKWWLPASSGSKELQARYAHPQAPPQSTHSELWAGPSDLHFNESTPHHLAIAMQADH